MFDTRGPFGMSHRGRRATFDFIYALATCAGPFHQIPNPLSPLSICRGTLSLKSAKVDKMSWSIRPLKACWEVPGPRAGAQVPGHNEWSVVYVVSAASLSPLNQPLVLPGALLTRIYVINMKQVFFFFFLSFFNEWFIVFKQPINCLFAFIPRLWKYGFFIVKTLLPILYYKITKLYLNTNLYCWNNFFPVKTLGIIIS